MTPSLTRRVVTAIIVSVAVSAVNVGAAWMIRRIENDADR